MAYYFFSATRSASGQIAELFNFIWPTATALWNLRWQVGGFLQEVPNATPQQLTDRFVFGSKIHGANLRDACINTTWDEQKAHLSGIILTNAFAIYEHWADEILEALGMPEDSGKNLQFDDQPASGGKRARKGLPTTIAELCTKESQITKRCFYPAYRSSPKYSWSRIQNMLACYRYFKEVRNSQIHNGGITSKRAANAYTVFAPLSSKHAVGMKGDLIIEALNEGDPIKLHLRGVVGFCDILFRMMVTIDAELSRAAAAESILEQALRSGKKLTTFNSQVRRRRAQIKGICRAAMLPPPHEVDALGDFMITKGLVSR